MQIVLVHIRLSVEELHRIKGKSMRLEFPDFAIFAIHADCVHCQDVILH